MKNFKELATALSITIPAIEGRTAEELEIEGQLEAYPQDIPKRTNFKNYMKRIDTGDIKQ